VLGSWKIPETVTNAAMFNDGSSRVLLLRQVVEYFKVMNVQTLCLAVL